MGKHNSAIHEVLAGRLFRESPLVGAAANWGRLTRYFGWPMLALYLFGPSAIEGSQGSFALYFFFGMPVILSAVALRWWCLGYARETSFIVNGPYRYVRNPVELSCVLAYLGAAILLRFPGWYTVLCGFLCALHMSFVAIAYDRQLLERYGSQYLRYVQRVRRWLPASLPATNARRPDYNLTRAVLADVGVWIWLVGFLTVFAVRTRYGSSANW
jgi:protein-S-isoprenylcysteine O-methyltransferase Ste14